MEVVGGLSISTHTEVVPVAAFNKQNRTARGSLFGCSSHPPVKKPQPRPRKHVWRPPLHLLTILSLPVHRIPCMTLQLRILPAVLTRTAPPRWCCWIHQRSLVQQPNPVEAAPPLSLHTSWPACRWHWAAADAAASSPDWTPVHQQPAHDTRQHRDHPGSQHS